MINPFRFESLSHPRSVGQNFSSFLVVYHFFVQPITNSLDNASFYLTDVDVRTEASARVFKNVES